MATPSIPREIGSTGLRYTGQDIIDDELVQELKWPYSLETYQKMKSDPIVAGSLFMIKQYIRKVDWEVQPFGGLQATDEDKRKAKIVSDSLFKYMNRSWDQLVTDIVTFIENGFSFHMPTYKIHEGNVIWKDFPTRAANTIVGFEFNDKGYLNKIEQAQVEQITTGSFKASAGKASVKIPYEKLLHFRTDSEKNNPLGRSILKNAYKAWYMKTKLEYFESVGIEREMNGLPVLEIPSEYFAADPNDDPERYAILQEFIRIGTNARNNEQACVILPSDTDESGSKLFTFDLIASKGTRSIDTSKVIERYDYRIAQSMLSDFILMGSSSTGSFALSDNKVGTFVQSLEAYLEIIAEQFNRKAIPKLYELNGWDETETCQLAHKPIGSASLKDLGDFLDRSKNFITPDSTLENALRTRADLPERDDGNLYVSVPTSAHQALSQRIGMTQSVDSIEPESQEQAIDEDLAQAENIMKGLMGGQYDG